MAMQDLPVYPLPSLPTILDRVDAALTPFLSVAELTRYREATAALFSPISNLGTNTTEIDENDGGLYAALRASTKELTGKQNWATDWFKELLLSQRTPISTTMRLCVRLGIPTTQPFIPPLPSHCQPRLQTAARILYAAAVFAIAGFPNPTTTQSLYMPQISGILSTSRVPGTTVDALRTTSREKSRHALVWTGGRVWSVTVIGAEGEALSMQEILSQLDDIFSKAMQDPGPPLVPLAKLSSISNRPDWKLILDTVETDPTNGAHLTILRSAMMTLALEAYPAPAEPEVFLEDLRTGSACIEPKHGCPRDNGVAPESAAVGPVNRWADQTLGGVVYSDGNAGLVFDHVPTDFGAAVEFSRALMRIINGVPPAPRISGTKYSPLPLVFSWPSTLPIPTPHSLEPLPRSVHTRILDYPASNSPSSLAAEPIRLQITDAIVGLALQYSLLRMKGGEPEAISQPVWQRAFVDGRCDPMWPVSVESTALARALFSTDKASVLVNKFSAYLSRRRSLISLSQTGLAPGYCLWSHIHPLVAELSAREDAKGRDYAEVVKRTWEANAGLYGSVQFTGFVSKNTNNSKGDGVVAGLANIYMDNQLVVFYLSQPTGEMSLTILGTGRYLPLVSVVGEGMSECWERILEVAGKWAGE